MSKVFRSAYSAKERVSITFFGKGRTKQSFKAECDINNIMARFRKSGVLDFVTKHQARYADVSAESFVNAMNTVAQARSMFFDMPAHVRDRFGNKPEEFLAFVQNPGNRDEARALGLLKPEAPAAEPVAKPSSGASEAKAGEQGGGSTPPRSEASLSERSQSSRV